MVLSWASLGGEERRCLLRFGRARWWHGNANWQRSRRGSDLCSAAPKHGRPPEPFSRACCPGLRARQAGFWPRRPGLSGPTACSRCSGAAAGTLMPYAIGVARQYSGTAGRIENCQIGVFLAYASRFGQALIDRRLYLPEAWAQDESKRAKAGVPDGVTFATKPQIACELIARALDAGAPCAWVLADALYGSDSRLRRMLETRGQPDVLAVRSNHCLRFWTEEGLEETAPATMADALAREAWATHAAGEGSKGLRLSEWARIALSSTADPGFEHWLLIRRSRREP